MNVSYKWLREFTDVDVEPSVFMRELCMTGTEVTGFGSPGQTLSDIRVGRINTVSKHPDAERLFICSVDVGLSEPIQIVTAATNIFEGATVPVVMDGGSIYDGTVIKKGKLRGEVSMGMFCSVAELGLTVSDYPGAVEDGILILKEGVPGEDVKKLLGLDDTVFNADIMTNRPDCLSVRGVAREAAVTFRKPFRTHTPVVRGEGADISDYLKVSVSDPELCTRYAARIVTDINIQPSPQWMIQRLRSSGVRAINNIVDITNYVMLEYGQPMHAFDYSCIDGGEIIVRRAKDGETLTTLDANSRTLTEDIVVIADADRAIGIAGIMGGENSEITENTKAVVFESAVFNGALIRRGAKHLGMRTEASSRFEKGLDPQTAMQALDRACELIELLGAGKVSRNCIDVDFSEKQPRRIPLEKDWINYYLNTDISQEQMTDILTRLGFAVEDGIVSVPSFRTDVQTKYDISEEVARFYGYDNIPSKNLMIETRADGYTDRQRFEAAAGRLLRANGFTETATFSFISPKAFDKILIPKADKLRDALKIQNPLGEDSSVMRTTALPSMLDTLARNHAYRAENAAVYEIATLYIKGKEGQLPAEPKKIVMGAYGQDEDFFTLKGALENLFEGLGIHGLTYQTPQEPLPSYHPGISAQIERGGQILGVCGQLHPNVSANYDIDRRIYAAELDLEAMFQARDTGTEYSPIPKYPSVSRDLSLICADSVYSGQIEAKIKQAAGKYLEKIKVFDVYTGKQIPQGCKSIAYSLSLRSADHTLTEEQTEKIMLKIVAALENEGIQLRR